MLPLKIDDIQVFIPTYNRPGLLRIALDSVLSQTLPVSNISVVDNGQDSSTKSVVDEYKSRGVLYHNSSHLGRLGNMLLAQQLLNKKYVLLLHDDDQIHPDYLSIVLRAINANINTNLLTCLAIPWHIGTERKTHPVLHNRGHLFTQREYATFVYNSGHPSFSLAVYESESFKRLSMSSLLDTYGKWHDVPLMIEAIGSGHAVVFLDTCGWMGLHPGQDSNDSSTRPPFQSWINREAKFYHHLGDDLLTLSGLSFCIMNYRHLKSGFKRRIRPDVNFSKFLDEARSNQALTRRGEYFRFFSPIFIQKLFEKLLHRYYSKTAKPLF